MPSIKAITTAYGWGHIPAFIGAVYITGFSWIAAGVFLFAYALVGPMLLRCPRCRLPTSGRVRIDRKGREHRSRMNHTPSPAHCSRCGLDFRLHSFGEEF